VIFFIANQGVRNVAERVLDRLSIGDQSLPLLRFGVRRLLVKYRWLAHPEVRGERCVDVGSGSARWSEEELKGDPKGGDGNWRRNSFGVIPNFVREATVRWGLCRKSAGAVMPVKPKPGLTSRNGEAATAPRIFAGDFPRVLRNS
jgi:hypothetical protein